jgi:hypothetical protein
MSPSSWTKGRHFHPQCVVSHIPSTEEINSPVSPRSEAEQLVGQELIKALSDYKQLVVAPFSPPAQQIYSTVKESNVKHLVSSQSFSCHQRNKIKCQKPAIKVVRDLLTKKWIFMKRKDLKSANC